MYGFNSTSYKHQRDQILLRRLRDALYVLKVQAQQRAAEHAMADEFIDEKRGEISQLLADLEQYIRIFLGDSPSAAANLDVAGLAERFIEAHSHDILDRLDEIGRVRENLDTEQTLTDLDFRRLDGVQSLLEAEAAEGVRGLYGF